MLTVSGLNNKMQPDFATLKPIGTPISNQPAQPDFATLKPVNTPSTDTQPPVAPTDTNPDPSLSPGNSKLADALGISKFGTAIGRTINNLTSTSYQDTLDTLKALGTADNQAISVLHNRYATPEELTKAKTTLENNNQVRNAVTARYSDIGTAGLSNKEVLGSAANTALLLASAGSPSGFLKGSGTLAASEIAAPVLKTGLSEVAKRIGGKALTGLATGGAFGVAQGLTDDKSLGDSLKQGLVTGTVGAILGGGTQALSEGVRALTAPQLTQKIYDNALGVSKKVAQSGRSPSVQLIKDGVVGTAKQIYDKAQNTIDTVDPQINNILNNSDKTISSEAVMATLAHGVNTSVGNEGAGMVSSSEIKQVIQDSLPQVRTLLNKDELTMPEVNKLRQIMDRTLGDRAFTGATLPFKKDVLYDAANSFRALVKKVEPETSPLFDEYSNSIGTIKALNSEMSKPHVMRHMLSLLSAAGGGIPGLAAGIANEAAQTTIGKTAAAVGLNKVGQVLQATDKSITADLIKRFGRTAALNVAKNAQ